MTYKLTPPTITLLMLLPLLIGSILGFALAQSNNSTTTIDKNTATNLHQASLSPEHEPYHLPSTALVPELKIAVFPDPYSGINVQLTTKNFTFDPKNASLKHQNNHGHAHIYVDGVKLNRVYSDWYHHSGLQAGEHTVRVTLNTNDHKQYFANNQPIEASQTFTTTGTKIIHVHEDGEIHLH